MSHTLEDKRLRLLGHVLRRPRQHPMHQTTFCTHRGDPISIDHKRSGRPRINWTKNNMQKAWTFIYRKNHPFASLAIPEMNFAIPDHVQKLKEEAEEYNAPFCSDNRESIAYRLSIGITI